MINKQYPNQYGLSYYHKGKKNRFTILTKEVVSGEIITDLMNEYNRFLNEDKSEKVSENNIIKFFNKNGLECVNRKYYK